MPPKSALRKGGRGGRRPSGHGRTSKDADDSRGDGAAKKTVKLSQTAGKKRPRQSMMNTPHYERAARAAASAADADADHEDDDARAARRPEPASDDEGDVAHEETEAGDGFAGAMSKIMARTVRTSNPVLAKRHTVSAKLAALEKREAATAKEVRTKRKAAKTAHMIAPDPAMLPYELQLRAIATKGVVALFNAISKHQCMVTQSAEGGAADDAAPTSREVSSRRSSGAAAGPSFLDLLRTATVGTAAPAVPTAQPGRGAAAPMLASRVPVASAKLGAAAGKTAWLSSGYGVAAAAADAADDSGVEDDGFGAANLLASDDDDE